MTASAPVSLAEARKRAGFDVIEPTGLPQNVVSRRPFLAPLAAWSKQSNTWSIDGAQLSFRHVRNNGRTFDILAVRNSPQS